MALNTLTGGNFRDLNGQPLSNGTLLFELSHDEQETGTPSQVVGGLKKVILLDNTGNVATGQSIETNDTMSPAGSYYIVMAFRSDGVRAWKAVQYVTVTTSPSPFNLNAVVPSNPPGAGTGGAPAGSLLLQTNGVNNGSQSQLNLVGGSGTTITDNGSGSVTISGGASFSTSGQGFFFGAQSYGPIAENSGVTLATTNQVVAVHLVLPYSITVSKVAMYVVTGSGTGNMCAGIYSADGNTKLIDAGTNAFDVHTSSQTLRSSTITPVALNPGTYWFAVGSTSGNSGSVTGHTLYTWMANLFNGNVTRFGTAANAISSGVMPTTLGVITAFTNITSVAIPAVMFQV